MADVLLILTDVENIFLNYGLATQVALKRVTARECRRYVGEGQFAEGSMLPKVTLDGNAGTTIVP